MPDTRIRFRFNTAPIAFAAHLSIGGELLDTRAGVGRETSNQISATSTRWHQLEGESLAATSSESKSLVTVGALETVPFPCEPLAVGAAFRS